jgi:5-keto-L-gluconate epimerase
MKKWKYALSSADHASDSAPVLLKGDICDNLKKAVKLGYKAIEVHTRETEEFDYEKIKKCCEDYNVSIAAIVTGRLITEGKCNLIDDKPYVTHAALVGMKQYIDIAARLKTNIVLGWAKGNIPENGKKDKYLTRLANNLSTLSAYAIEKEVKIYIEVINRYETNIFTTAQELIDFLNTNDLPNCFVHLDSFHMNIEEKNLLEAIRLSKGKLGYMHLADNTRCYPGSGMLDFVDILKTLEEIGYNGYLSVECLPFPNSTEAAKSAIDYLEKCNKRIK